MFNSVTGTSTIDNLFAGTFPEKTLPVTLLLSATTYKRGMVLGIVTASGKYALVDSTAEDGSESPVAVLLDTPDIDASAADKPGTVALTGDFNSDALIFGGTDTTATHAAALKAVNIYTDRTAQSVQ